MAPASLGVLIPIMGMLIGGFVIFSKSEIGRAFAHRLRGGPEGQIDLSGEFESLRAEVDRLRAELTETQERLDFTERLLAGSSKEA